MCERLQHVICFECLNNTCFTASIVGRPIANHTWRTETLADQTQSLRRCPTCKDRSILTSLPMIPPTAFYQQLYPSGQPRVVMDGKTVSVDKAIEYLLRVQSFQRRVPIRHTLDNGKVLWETCLDDAPILSTGDDVDTPNKTYKTIYPAIHCSCGASIVADHPDFLEATYGEHVCLNCPDLQCCFCAHGPGSMKQLRPHMMLHEFDQLFRSIPRPVSTDWANGRLVADLISVATAWVYEFETNHIDIVDSVAANISESASRILLHILASRPVLSN